MRLVVGALAASVCLGAAACGAAGDGEDLAAGGAGPSSGSSDGAGATGGAGVGGSFVGAGGGGQDSGCEKVDFLFIIDNSVSMQDQQAALIKSFPSFMTTITQTLSAKSDYHIMVADTDDWGRCTASNCMTGAEQADELCIKPANGYACKTKFDACDKTIGAGVVHPAGAFASNKPCALAGGKRYIVEGEPDLVGTFSCIASVGTAGNPAERPMDSLVAAMSPALNGPGGCNEGFLRDDAVLVVTFISDDPNYEDAGKPQDWYDAVVKAKGGNAASVVMLGLTPNFAGCQDGKGPPKGAHWSELIKLFGARGLEASVCSADYAPFFSQAVAIVDEACDEFEPPK